MAKSYVGAESAPNNPTLHSPNLRLAIGAALDRYGLAPARFGRMAVRDPRFVFDLRRGREPRPATEARVRAFISQLGEAL